MSTLVNEQTRFSKKPTLEIKLVGDTGVDIKLENYRLRIWNNNDKLLTFGIYYKDQIVKPPFSLFYIMETTKQTICLKITTTLRRCKDCGRQTPYVFWNHLDWLKHRVCFEHMTKLQRYMIKSIHQGHSIFPIWRTGYESHRPNSLPLIILRKGLT